MILRRYCQWLVGLTIAGTLVACDSSSDEPGDSEGGGSGGGVVDASADAPAEDSSDGAGDAGLDGDSLDAGFDATDERDATSDAMPEGGGGAEHLATSTGWVFTLRLDAASWWARGEREILTGSKAAPGSSVAAVETLMPKECSGLAVDAQNVFWSERGTPGATKPPSGFDSTVSEAEADTETLRRLVKATRAVDAFQKSPGLCELAIDGTFVYWSGADANGTDGAIYRAPLVGGAAETLASGEATHWMQVAVDPTNAYWAVRAEVRRVPIGGGVPSTLVSLSGDGGYLAVRGLLADQGYVYYGTSYGSIERVPADGSGGPQVLATGLSTTLTAHFELATDGVDLYFANQGAYADFTGTIGKLPLAGGAPTILAEGVNSPQGIAVDASHVYFTTLGYSGGGGAVWRLAK